MFSFAQIIGFDRNLVQSTPIAIIYRQTVQGSLLTDPCLCTDVVKDEKGDSKRQRTSYTRFQTLELEKEFHFNRLVLVKLRFFVERNIFKKSHQIFDAATKNRDRSRAVHVGEADQDLVRQPEDEVEEGAQDGRPGGPGPHGDGWPPPHGT